VCNTLFKRKPRYVVKYVQLVYCKTNPYPKRLFLNFNVYCVNTRQFRISSFSDIFVLNTNAQFGCYLHNKTMLNCVFVNHFDLADTRVNNYGARLEWIFLHTQRTTQ